MSTVTIEEAQAKLLELIERLTPGEAVVITCNFTTGHFLNTETYD